MAVFTTQRYCPSCRQSVLATKPATRHLVHLLFSIITCGIWVVGWIVIGVRNAASPIRCMYCQGVTTKLPRGG